MNKDPKEKKISELGRNMLISVVLLTLFGIALLFHFLLKPDNSKNEEYWFNIEMVEELTTAKCKYHVVTIHEKEGSFLGLEDQYAWFEYDVEVNAGINMDQVKIEEPTKDGVVKIHLPPSTIQSTNEIKGSKKNPVRDLGLLAELTVEKEDSIIRKATEKLKNEKQMKEVLRAARDNAKNVLEQYVKEIGKQMGKTYKVEWVEVLEEEKDHISKKSEK